MFLGEGEDLAAEFSLWVCSFKRRWAQGPGDGKSFLPFPFLHGFTERLLLCTRPLLDPEPTEDPHSASLRFVFKETHF